VLVLLTALLDRAATAPVPATAPLVTRRRAATATRSAVQGARAQTRPRAPPLEARRVHGAAAAARAQVPSARTAVWEGSCLLSTTTAWLSAKHTASPSVQTWEKQNQDPTTGRGGQSMGNWHNHGAKQCARRVPRTTRQRRTCGTASTTTGGIVIHKTTKKSCPLLARLCCFARKRRGRKPRRRPTARAKPRRSRALRAQA